ncbi:MAG: hypothetical protein EPO07_15665 [Verrucomicrobia bacterium]|nr:MAG: hypothetical protein EPO07_15665 [Verrucomicrobiota bacterium]
MRPELSGCIVTPDAMGCQQNISDEIIEADADCALIIFPPERIRPRESGREIPVSASSDAGRGQSGCRRATFPRRARGRQ